MKRFKEFKVWTNGNAILNVALSNHLAKIGYGHINEVDSVQFYVCADDGSVFGYPDNDDNDFDDFDDVDVDELSLLEVFNLTEVVPTRELLLKFFRTDVLSSDFTQALKDLNKIIDVEVKFYDNLWIATAYTKIDYIRVKNEHNHVAAVTNLIEELLRPSNADFLTEVE